jgi:hypothetical protein
MGPDAIEEYVRFLSSSSPYFDDGVSLNDRVDLLSSDSGVCTFRAFYTIRLEASNILYPGAAVHYTMMTHINFDYDANLISSWHLYFTPELFVLLFETWAGFERAFIYMQHHGRIVPNYMGQQQPVEPTGLPRCSRGSANLAKRFLHRWELTVLPHAALCVRIHE